MSRLDEVAKAIFEAGERVIGSKVTTHKCRSWEGVLDYIREECLEEAQAAIDAMQPEWSDEVPTEPGWYWFRVKGMQDRCFKVEYYLGCLRVVNPFTFVPEKSVYRTQGVGQWAPATPPEG